MSVGGIGGRGTRIVDDGAVGGLGGVGGVALTLPEEVQVAVFEEDSRLYPNLRSMPDRQVVNIAGWEAIRPPRGGYRVVLETGRTSIIGPRPGHDGAIAGSERTYEYRNGKVTLTSPPQNPNGEVGAPTGKKLAQKVLSDISGRDPGALEDTLAPIERGIRTRNPEVQARAVRTLDGLFADLKKAGKLDDLARLLIDSKKDGGSDFVDRLTRTVRDYGLAPATKKAWADALKAGAKPQTAGEIAADIEEALAKRRPREAISAAARVTNPLLYGIPRLPRTDASPAEKKLFNGVLAKLGRDGKLDDLRRAIHRSDDEFRRTHPGVMDWFPFESVLGRAVAAFGTRDVKAAWERADPDPRNV